MEYKNRTPVYLLNKNMIRRLCFCVYVCSVKTEFVNRTPPHQAFCFDAQFYTVALTCSCCKLLHFNVNVWQ